MGTFALERGATCGFGEVVNDGPGREMSHRIETFKCDFEKYVTLQRESASHQILHDD